MAVIQARMGSRRLPGKVLCILGGRSVLAHVVSRVKIASSIDEVVVATSTLQADDAIVDTCRTLDILCVRGSEADVLSRYALAANQTQADLLVRVTADCPFVSAAVIDQVVTARALKSADYASNTLHREFPRGLDVECYTRLALDSANLEATAPEEREHVTPFIYNHPSRFALTSCIAPEDWSWLRWTLDTHADLTFLKAIINEIACASDPAVDWRELARAVRDSPLLRELNTAAIASARDLSLTAPCNYYVKNGYLL